MIIFAMGDIIRVGINLSHISRCICLNPSWNKPDLAQLVKRFAREGNEDVKISLIVPCNTVHQAIVEHADEKEIESLIFKYGGALTEEDLEKYERKDLSDKVVVTRGRVFLGTLIRNSLDSDKRKLHMFFRYMDGLNKEEMELFVETYGHLFSELYVKMWDRGYGGNNGRCVAGLFKELENENIISGRRYADLGCGHMALENTLFDLDGNTKNRKIFNLDINGHLLETGRTILKVKNANSTPVIHSGSFTDMKDVYQDEYFDAINSSMAIYCTKLGHNRKKNLHKDERVHSLLEFNRILKPGGVMVLTLPKNACSNEEFEVFTEQMEKHFGFEIITEYTGQSRSTDSSSSTNYFSSHVLVCRKIKAPSLKDLNLADLKLTRTKTKKNGGAKKINDPVEKDEEKGHIHTEFQINNKNFECDVANAVEKRTQRAFLENIERIRARLIRIYEDNGNSFNNLPKGTKAELILHRIRVIDYGHNKPGFIHLDDPNPVLRPWSIYED